MGPAGERFGWTTRSSNRRAEIHLDNNIMYVSRRTFWLVGVLIAGALICSAGATTPDPFLAANGINIRNGHGTGDVVPLHGANLGAWLLMEGWMCPLDSSGTSRRLLGHSNSRHPLWSFYRAEPDPDVSEYLDYDQRPRQHPRLGDESDSSSVLVGRRPNFVG